MTKSELIKKIKTKYGASNMLDLILVRDFAPKKLREYVQNVLVELDNDLFYTDIRFLVKNEGEENEKARFYPGSNPERLNKFQKDVELYLEGKIGNLKQNLKSWAIAEILEDDGTGKKTWKQYLLTPKVGGGVDTVEIV